MHPRSRRPTVPARLTRGRAIAPARAALAAGLAAALVSLAACGGAARSAEAPAPAPEAPRQAAPLAPFAGQQVVVTPAQRVLPGDLPEWTAAAGEAAALLAAVDSGITGAVGARVQGWKFADAVVRSARRNPTLGVDPTRLTIEPLMEARPPEQLTGPIGGQLRALVAIEGQRYVVVPNALRFARRADGRGEAVLHLAVVDARAARRLWAGEVRSDPADAYAPALVRQAAARVADLVSPP